MWPWVSSRSPAIKKELQERLPPWEALFFFMAVKRGRAAALS